MADYREAPEVADLAQKLIDSVEDHEPLRDPRVRVECVYRDKATRSKGRVQLGKARKVSGLNAFLANPESVQRDLFVIEIAEDCWDRLTDDQQLALVDHELAHCRVEYDDVGTPQLSVVGHDLEEFEQIIRRHGLWQSDVASFGSAVQEQLALAVDEVTTFVERIVEDDG